MNESRQPEDLLPQRCEPCEAGIPPLSRDAVNHNLDRVPGWELSGGKLVRTFSFKNYYQTVAFVNAVAWLAHREDHHPDMELGYKTCTVRYYTHSIGGLSENDFICAARINALAA